MNSFASLARLLVAVFSIGFVTLAARAQTALPAAQVGQSYSFTITTTPAAPAGTVYGATGLPTGVAINAATGVISGIPTTAGNYSGTLSLTSSGITNNLNYTLLVNAAAAAPAITSATTATATVGQAFSYTVTASNSPTSFNVGTLPAGLSFNTGTSQISGTPTLAGTAQITLSANNASGTGAATTLTLTINPAGPVPVVTSATSANATAAGGSSFTVNYQITASNTPVSFAASGLPLGVSVNTSTGLISGTTTVQGVYSVTLTATNNNGTSAATTLTLTVGSTSTITSAATLTLTQNQAMSAFTLTGTNSPGSFNVSGLPAGLTVNSTTGVITGTPTAAGTFPVTVSANNTVGTGPSATLTVTVNAPSGGGGGGGGSSAPVITSPSTANAVVGLPFTFAVTTTPAATSYTATGLPSGVSINATTGVLSGTFTATGQTAVTIIASGSGGTAVQVLFITVNALPTISAQPQSTSVAIGGSVVLGVTGTGTPSPTYQWRKNGVAIAGAVSPVLSLSNVQVGDAGAYSVVLTNIAGSTTSQSAVVGITSTAKVAGSGSIAGSDIRHPNGNIYDQVLLTGTSATITADAGQVTRMSFVDLNDDIVQVEFSGAGTLTVTLENASGPAAPVKYNQPGIQYMKGHPSIVLSGVNASTYLRIFSVGTVTAVNQSLFKAGETYDGMAGVGLLSIASTDGKMAAIFAGNVNFFRASGLTGIDARSVAVQGATYIGEITADADATPVLTFGSTTDLRVTGGDLLQLNNRAVQIDGINAVAFTAGTTSHGGTLPAQTNRARFERNGTDVTNQVVAPAN